VVDARWGETRFVENETFVDRLGQPNAHAYIYRLGDAEDTDCDEHDARWGVDRYATVIVGARYSQQPVVEISNCLPASKVNRERALERAAELWPNPRLAGYVYLSPLNEWFEFMTDAGLKHLHSRELAEYDLSELEPVSRQEYSTWGQAPHPGWEKIADGGFLAAKKNKIEDVPYALWSYGCSPTASSMIFDYWDRRGYPRLVDYYFDRWDHVEKEQDHDLTNVHRELAEAMHTDSMSGGTSLNSITAGHVQVANSMHGYSFGCASHNAGNAGNYGIIISEVDEGRPSNWSVLGYMYHGSPINHSVCAVGYEITTSNDSFVVVHNTWDRAEHLWAHRSGGSVSYLYTVNPNGEQDEDLRLASFVSGSSGYKGIKYPLLWNKEGKLTSIKVWRAKDDKKNHWELLETASGDDDYILLEMSNDFTDTRLNIEGYSGSTLRAADGTPSPLDPKDMSSNPHFIPKGHVPIQGYSMKHVIYKDNVVYLLQGHGGVQVVEPHEDYLVPLVTLCPHSADDMALAGDWLYVLGDDKLSVYDVSAAASPVLTGTYELAGNRDQIAAYGEFIYLGGLTDALEVLRCSDKEVTTVFNLPDSVVTELKVIDGKLYVIPYGNGVKIYDLSDPGTPQLERTVSTENRAYDVARWSSTLLVAEKGAGVELIDLSGAGDVLFEPGASVYKVAVAADRAFLICRQGGLLVCNISGPTSLEVIGQFTAPKSTVEGIGLGDRIYLACGFDGLFALESDLTGLAEEPASLEVRLGGLLRPGASLGSIKMGYGGKVAVEMLDVAGRRVLSVVESRAPGVHPLPSVPSGLPAGVYFVSVKTGSERRTGKVVLIR